MNLKDFTKYFLIGSVLGVVISIILSMNEKKDD